MGRPPKDKTVTTTSMIISDRDKMYVRLKCLLAVVENGNRISAQAPEETAEKYFKWIMGETKSKSEQVAPKKSSPLQPEKDIAPSQIIEQDIYQDTTTIPNTVTSLPKSRTGLAQVLIS